MVRLADVETLKRRRCDHVPDSIGFATDCVGRSQLGRAPAGAVGDSDGRSDVPREPNHYAAFWTARFQGAIFRLVLRIGPTSEYRGIRIGTGPADNDRLSLKRISDALDLISEHDPRVFERLREYFGGFVVRDGKHDEIVEPTPFGMLLFSEHSLCVRGPPTEALACHIVMAYWTARELGVLPLRRHPQRRAIRVIGALAYRWFAMRLPYSEALVQNAEAEVERYAGVAN